MTTHRVYCLHRVYCRITPPCIHTAYCGTSRDHTLIKHIVYNATVGWVCVSIQAVHCWS